MLFYRCHIRPRRSWPACSALPPTDQLGVAGAQPGQQALLVLALW